MKFIYSLLLYNLFLAIDVVLFLSLTIVNASPYTIHFVDTKNVLNYDEPR